MTKTLVLGAILGGLVAFLWSNVSWEILPWHERTLLTFQDEDAVGRVVTEHAASSGVYLFPAGPKQAGMTKEQKKAAEAAAWEKMQKGPVVFAAIRREGFTSAAFTRGDYGPIFDPGNRGLLVNLDAPQDERTKLLGPGGISDRSWIGGGSDQRLAQLELVGLLGKLHYSSSSR